MKFQTKKRFGAAAIAAGMLVTATPSFAEWDTSYPQDGDHPLRIVHYFVHPIGKVLEWTVTRPLAVMGHVVAPYHHIDSKGFTGCSRERPARSCPDVIK